MAAFDDGLVFAKTERGVAEVAQRAAGLSMMERRILIMTDGVRTVADLALLVKPGEIAGLLGRLEALGLVHRIGGFTAVQRPLRAAEPVATGFGATDEAEATSSLPAGDRNLLTVDEVKRRAVRELNDRLGPEAESMALRFENCRGADELRDRLREAERLVAGFLGEPAAQDFMRSLRRR